MTSAVHKDTGLQREHKQLAFPWDDEDRKARHSFTAHVDSIIRPAKKEFDAVKAHPLQFVLSWFPFLTWIRVYNWRTQFPSDLMAGLSVGCMVVPQGMSYANLAGLPSVYGLYGAFLPCIVYGFLGTSRQLAVGPVAVTSLLIGNGLKDILPLSADIANPNTPTGYESVQADYNRLAIQLSFIVACLYTAVGLLRLGFLTNFLSHSVISGFTSGASIIIGLSQVKYLLGYKVPRKDAVQEQLKDLSNSLDNFLWREWVMGVLLLLWLQALKKIASSSKKLTWLRAIGPLSACIIGLIAVYAGNIDEDGIKIIQTIPKGLPSPSVSHWFPMPKFKELIGLAIIVTLVDLLESMSIAKALARKNGYELVPNREITGLGAANFAGSIFNAYTTTGSFSRSAVNNDVGATSPLAQMICGVLVMFVLLFLTPVFEKLPYNVLGAIIISGLSSLFDIETAVYLFKVSKKDLLVWLASFFGTIFAGVEIGLAIAIGLAVFTALYETIFPHTAKLGRIPGTSVYRNVEQYSNAELPEGILLYRIDAPLYFANVNHVRDRLRTLVKEGLEDDAYPLQYVILELSPVTHVDATGLHALHEVHAELKDQGITLALANPTESVVHSLELDNLQDVIGVENIFVTVHDAVEYAKTRISTKAVDGAENGKVVARA